MFEPVEQAVATAQARLAAGEPAEQVLTDLWEAGRNAALDELIPRLCTCMK